MSADIGEPGHETSGWTHAICVACWCAKHPDRTPTTITGDDAVPCCYCGAATSNGIYTRDNAQKVHRPMTPAPTQQLPATQEQRYTVDEEQADDPEGNYHRVLTIGELREEYPSYSMLFLGDGTESLDYVHELYRIRIRPLETTDGRV